MSPIFASFHQQFGRLAFEGSCTSGDLYTQINAILLATSPLNHSTAGSGLKTLGNWLGLQTLAKDSCVSATELPLREILIKAVQKSLSFLLPLVILFVGQLFRSCDQNRVFSPSHSWIMDILLLLGQLYGLSGSSCRLCLEIEIIFQNVSLYVSTFLGENSDFEDSCKASSSSTGTEEVNCEAEEVKDNHKVVEDSCKEEKTIKRRNGETLISLSGMISL